MKKSIPDWLIVSLWRALLGEIYPSLRAIAISFSGNKELVVCYYLDRNPIEMDYESVETVATNISASVGLDLIKNIEVKCEFVAEPFGKIDCLDGFVYCRREYDI